jgi:hypothetical protein
MVSVCGHGRHDFRRNPAHILKDDFRYMETRTRTRFQILRQNAPRLFFSRDALRMPLGVQCGLLLVRKVYGQAHGFFLQMNARQRTRVPT